MWRLADRPKSRAIHRKLYVTIFVHGQTSQEPVNTEPHKCESWLWCSVGDIPTPRFQPLQLFLDAKVSLF